MVQVEIARGIVADRSLVRPFHKVTLVSVDSVGLGAIGDKYSLECIALLLNRTRLVVIHSKKYTTLFPTTSYMSIIICRTDSVWNNDHHENHTLVLTGKSN